jgi:hypothetical protein
MLDLTSVHSKGTLIHQLQNSIFPYLRVQTDVVSSTLSSDFATPSRNSAHRASCNAYRPDLFTAVPCHVPSLTVPPAAHLPLHHRSQRPFLPKCLRRCMHQQRPRMYPSRTLTPLTR